MQESADVGLSLPDGASFTVGTVSLISWAYCSNYYTVVSSSFMEIFISRQTTTNLWFFSTSGTGNALNYINLMHQMSVA